MARDHATTGLPADPPRIDHFGIVVPDLGAAAALYRTLGCEVTEPVAREGQGIAKAFVRFANMTVELIAPTTTTSPIKDRLEQHNASDFLARQPEGGLHHVCFALPDLATARTTLAYGGYRELGTNPAPPAAAVWLDPAGANGVLIELKQGAAAA